MALPMTLLVYTVLAALAAHRLVVLLRARARTRAWIAYLRYDWRDDRATPPTIATYGPRSMRVE